MARSPGIGVGAARVAVYMYSARGSRHPVARRQPQGRSPDALKITAPDLIARHVVDGIVPEPLGGAHQDPDSAAAALDAAVSAALAEVSALDTATRLQARYERFRRLGTLGDAIIDTAAPAAAPVRTER